ncbi:hypothetical protein D3C80_2161530 [compost metagenome]
MITPPTGGMIEPNSTRNGISNSYIPPIASTMPTAAATRVAVRRCSLRSKWQAAAETL